MTKAKRPSTRAQLGQLKAALQDCEGEVLTARREAQSQAHSREESNRELARALGEVTRLAAEVASLQKGLAELAKGPERKKLPKTRSSLTRKFEVPRAGEEPLSVYITAGTYEDGRLGEVFLKCDRQGSLTSGALDAVAMCLSVGLQYGVPLEAYTSKLVGMRFDPAGLLRDDTYKSCASVLDLVARWLRDKFEPKKDE
jgi:ribonucleoside-diphosphate reductase alpha chain